MFVGLFKFDEGCVSVIGFDLLKDDSVLYVVFGYMLQKFGLYEDLMVMENLILYVDLCSVIGEVWKKIFDCLLEFIFFGLFIEWLVGKFFGGMK